MLVPSPRRDTLDVDVDLHPDDADADEESDSDFSTPLDIYSAFNEDEPVSTSRWNEALQQHEQAETGLDLTVSMRSDYLSPDELDHEADDLTVSQPVLPRSRAERGGFRGRFR